MLTIRRAPFLQIFYGRPFFGGRLAGFRLRVLGLRPWAQKHGDLKTFIGIGRANRLRFGNNYSFTPFTWDVFGVICHRLLSIPGAGMERESWTGGEGKGSANLLGSRKT